jgi:peptide/nickel transport system ATP-binding protein
MMDLSMNQEVPLLETRNVTRNFTVGMGIFSKKQRLTAVAGVSLTINKGDVVGLVGESGCGKSTLALMLLGLLPPSSGEILINGTPVSTIPRLNLARDVQPIFQDPYSSLNPRKTIGDIIGLPLKVHNIGAP